MNRLARVDLDRLRIDSEGFLGQAIALGVRFKKLPEHAPEALLAYLRTTGTSFAQRYQSGIAISRDGLERGVRQALVCMELGLEAASGGDLNAAVDLLSGGDFEAFRKRGWEIAFTRLQEMQAFCGRLLDRPEAALLADNWKAIARWAELVPELWASPPEEEGEEEEAVDPLRDYATFREVKARADFMQVLPRQALDAFLEAGEGTAFDDLLRNLVLALALDLETLTPGRGQVADFEARCFEGGKLRPEVREKVVEMVKGRFEQVVADEEMRALLMREVEAGIELLEATPDGTLEGFFVVAK